MVSPSLKSDQSVSRMVLVTSGTFLKPVPRSVLVARLRIAKVNTHPMHELLKSLKFIYNTGA